MKKRDVGGTFGCLMVLVVFGFIFPFLWLLIPFALVGGGLTGIARKVYDKAKNL